MRLKSCYGTVMQTAYSSAQKHFLTPAQCLLPSQPALPSGCRTGTKGVQERDTTQIPKFLQQDSRTGSVPLLLGWARTNQVQCTVPANKC